MVTLGEHLGADQQTGVATVDGGEHLFHRALARRAVAVDAQHRVIREQDAKPLFGALGPGADRAQVHLAAIGAVARRALDMPAVVAAQFVVPLVQGHARIAALALAEPAAVVAEQGWGEAAAVEIDQYLLSGCECLADGLLQRAGYAGVQGATFHIQPQETRLLGIAGALAQLE